jgi:acetyl esterase/lipase
MGKRSLVNESRVGNGREMRSCSLILKDVPYATESDAQKLDIYLPSGSTEPYPVVVWMHPGGFYEGDKGGGGTLDPLIMVDMTRIAEPLLERGYAAVSINYRLSHEAPFPALVFDAKASIRWIRANAARYGFDRERIAAWGSSAGGYLAALLATSGGAVGLEDLSLGNSDEPSRICAAVDWYGPTDFLEMDSQHIQIGQNAWHDDAESPESRLMGGPLQMLSEKCKASSPITYIGPGCAPIYIQHGKNDDIVPYLQSVVFTERLRSVAGSEKVILEVIENTGHADLSFFTRENVNKALDFLDRFMK